MIGNHNHILLVRINDFDALDSQEKLVFPPPLEFKFRLSIGKNMDSHNNFLSFRDWAL